MAKQFELLWVCESFSEDPTFFTKRMFGGMAIYVHGLMVMLLSESPGERSFRGKEFKFDIWDGILYPTDRERQVSLLEEWPELKVHPVLPKWVFLPRDLEDFEEIAEVISRRIYGHDPRFGIIPNLKKKASKAKKKTQKKKVLKKATKKKVTKKKVQKKTTKKATAQKKKTQKTSSRKTQKTASKKRVTKKKRS